MSYEGTLAPPPGFEPRSHRLTAERTTVVLERNIGGDVVVRLRAFQANESSVSHARYLSKVVKDQAAGADMGWLGDQDSNLDWRCQRPQSLPLDDLPKLVVGPQGIEPCPIG